MNGPKHALRERSFASNYHGPVSRKIENVVRGARGVEPSWQGSLQFRTCLSAHARKLAGKPAEAKGTLRAGVSLWTLLLADDMWVAADTRANLAANLNTFVRIGRAFGLEMHAAASPGAESKTLAMMVPAVNSQQEKDLQDIQLEDGRTVPFATVVKYLGRVQ